MAELRFDKMHGAGNDFVVLDLRAVERDIDAGTARHLADRRRGVGCDQLLIVRRPQAANSLARYEIRNADGSAAGQCGNGARCIALYLAMRGETPGDPFILESPAGPVETVRCADGEFEIDMGEPVFEPERIPLALEATGTRYRIDSPWGELAFDAASMGNPHALIQVEDIEQAPLETTGAWLGRNPVFPEGCNVGFTQIIDRQNIRLRVFERGAGETPACGSGACAAVAMLRRKNLVDDTVNVFLPGGHLVIKWRERDRVKMKGPAVHVFSGSLRWNDET
ncbi:diaminopimelate epimerase [Elongatibacter sediminis]|uniref:Diaminopimelate epimerase n=1 Tax=Elongatibacter sediminis TaxID=3119006 RepID=A0AAW9RID9_9GAMM